MARPAAPAGGVTKTAQAVADNLVGYIALFCVDTQAVVAPALHRPIRSDEFKQVVCTEKTSTECATPLSINADIRRLFFGI
jgi:hypothetical protein